jgi:hypothetical protein
MKIIYVYREAFRHAEVVGCKMMASRRKLSGVLGIGSLQNKRDC